MQHPNVTFSLRPGVELPSACLLYPAAPAAGVHQLVESISALQGEKSRLTEELAGLRLQAEEQQREKQQLAGNFHHQVRPLFKNELVIGLDLCISLLCCNPL